MRVYLASEDAHLSTALGEALASAGVPVESGAAAGTEGLGRWLAAASTSDGASVVLLDARLAEAAGWLATARAAAPSAQVVALVREGEPPPEALLAAGVDDVLQATGDPAWLRARLGLLSRGARPGGTEAWAAQVALRSSTQFFALADRELKVLGSGGAASAASGLYQVTPVPPGEPLLAALLPVHREAVAPLLQRALAGERNRIELAVQRHDGNRVSRGLAVEPALDERGAPVGVTLWIADDDARVQAILTLSQNEARFRALVQNSTDITSVFGKDGSLLYASPTIERVTGRPLGALVGRAINDLIHPDDLRPLLDHIARRDSGPIVTRIRHLVGYWVHLESVLSNMLRDPNVRGIVVNSRDITERVRAQAAIREREESLWATLNSIGEAVISTDDGGRVARMNPVAERLTGFLLSEARGRPLGEIARFAPGIGPDGAPGSLGPSLVDRVMAGDTMVRAGARALLTRDGSERPVAATAAPIRDLSRRVAGVVLVLRDITDEQRAAEALRRSERSFRTLIERAPESILVERDGRVVYGNPTAVALLGIDTPEALVGRPMPDLLAPEEREEARLREEQMRERGQPSPIHEERLLREGGGVVLVESIGLPVDFDGAPAIVHIARDITSRKQLESRLLVADRMVSVGTLAAGVAHEINNPLAAVTANLRYLLEELADLESQLPAPRVDELRDAIADAQEGAERVRVIVRDLKAFSRGDEVVRGTIDIVNVLQSTSNLAANEIRHRARLVKSFGPVPPVHGNEARLGQMVLNMLLNAVHAIVEGQADKNEIRLTSRTDELGRAVIEVADTGAGIPPELHKRIFDPFFTTKPVGVGTGLGLFVCHGIVTSLGGEITVDSAEGRGTTFRVTLPPAPEAPAAPPREPPPLTTRRGRVLVVDDEPMILISVRRLLASEHEVRGVTSAREALAQVEAGDRYDVILCDLMMPEMTGMELHSRLRDLAPEQAERMVFLTGGAFTPRAREFLDEVKNPRLDKPFEATLLRGVVRELVT